METGFNDLLLNVDPNPFIESIAMNIVIRNIEKKSALCADFLLAPAECLLASLDH